jgi:peptide deformylase
MQLVEPNAPILFTLADRVSLKEGRELGRRLAGFLEAHNKRACKARKKTDFPELSPGYAIAAPQVGIAKRVIAIVEGMTPCVLVNPRIVESSKARIYGEESCLSFPGQTVEVYRHTWVTVACDNWAYQQMFGWQDGIITPASLLSSHILQHEIAHCYGLTMHDFVEKEYPRPEEWEDWALSLPQGKRRKPGGVHESA